MASTQRAATSAPTGPLKKLGIKGRGDRALAQEWEDGPQSPSVLSNMPVSIEQHVKWITECIAHMRRNELASEPGVFGEIGAASYCVKLK